MSLVVEIVTPSHVFCCQEVASLVVDSSLGELEILPQHQPLIAVLETGSARLKFNDGHTESIATSSGILHLENDYVVLAVEQAVDVNCIDVDGIDDAKALAQQALQRVIDQGNLEQNELDLLSAKVRSELLKKLKK